MWQKPVLTIDLAPTIVALANGILPSNMDGKPFLSKSSDHVGFIHCRLVVLVVWKCLFL